MRIMISFFFPVGFYLTTVSQVLAFGAKHKTVVENYALASLSENQIYLRMPDWSLRQVSIPGLHVYYGNNLSECIQITAEGQPLLYSAVPHLDGLIRVTQGASIEFVNAVESSIVVEKVTRKKGKKIIDEKWNLKIPVDENRWCLDKTSSQTCLKHWSVEFKNGNFLTSYKNALNEYVNLLASSDLNIIAEKMITLLQLLDLKLKGASEYSEAYFRETRLHAPAILCQLKTTFIGAQQDGLRKEMLSSIDELQASLEFLK